MLQSRIQPEAVASNRELRAIRGAYQGRTMQWASSLRLVLLALFAVLAIIFSVQALAQAFGPAGDRLTVELASIVDSFEAKTGLS